MDSECFMKTVQACDVLLLKVLPIIVRVTSTRVRTAVRYQAPGQGMLYGNSLFLVDMLPGCQQYSRP